MYILVRKTKITYLSRDMCKTKINKNNFNTKIYLPKNFLFKLAENSKQALPTSVFNSALPLVLPATMVSFKRCLRILICLPCPQIFPWIKTLSVKNIIPGNFLVKIPTVNNQKKKCKYYVQNPTIKNYYLKK